MSCSPKISIFELYIWLNRPKFVLSNARWFIGFTSAFDGFTKGFSETIKIRKNVNFSYYRSIPNLFFHPSIRFTIVDDL